MIGIIGAMDVEVDGIKNNIENCKTEEISGIKFCYGKIYGKDVVIAKSGEGKVNSAITTQTMIIRFKPDFIINSGVAGGLHSKMKVMDIAIADAVCQHDFDISPLGYKPGYIPQVEQVEMKCAQNLNIVLENCAKKMCDSEFYKGIIASGDQFIASDEQRNKIKNTFGAIAAEMEGASIGHVAYMNNVSFSVLRVMSDNASGESNIDFPKFCELAAEKSIKICKSFFESY